MKIFENTKCENSKYGIKTSIEIFRCDNGIKIVINNEFNDNKISGIHYLSNDMTEKITNSIINTRDNGILTIDLAEKYKLNNTECPYHKNDVCTIPTGFRCKRKNQFGYCNSNYVS